MKHHRKITKKIFPDLLILEPLLRKWKNEKNVKVYSVLIDVSYNSDICLKLFSDKIYKLSTIRQDSADDLALTLFTSV